MHIYFLPVGRAEPPSRRAAEPPSQWFPSGAGRRGLGGRRPGAALRRRGAEGRPAAGAAGGERRQRAGGPGMFFDLPGLLKGCWFRGGDPV